MKDEYGEIVELVVPIYKDKLSLFDYEASSFELVRCEDCKNGGIDSTSYPQYWCSAHSEYHEADYFCADGERREHE